MYVCMYLFTYVCLLLFTNVLCYDGIRSEMIESIYIQPGFFPIIVTSKPSYQIDL